jgi:hypothetical protein
MTTSPYYDKEGQEDRLGRRRKCVSRGINPDDGSVLADQVAYQEDVAVENSAVPVRNRLAKRESFLGL